MRRTLTVARPGGRSRRLRTSFFVVVLLAGCGGDSADNAGESAAGSTSTTATGSKPLGDAFYEPPDPLPEAEPGTLIRQEELEPFPDGTRGWRVLYHSRAVDGGDIAVSGVVFVPPGDVPSEGRPIIVAGSPPIGLADGCSASKRGFGPPIEVMQPLFDAGYVVAVTDYEGLGTPGVHPYGAGVSAGRTMLDIARAAVTLKESDAQPEVVIYGESAGGHAALFATDIAPEYAPELEVLGTVAQTPLLSLVGAMRQGPSSPQLHGYLMMFLVGLNEAYPERAPLEAVLTEQGLAERDEVTEQCSNDVLRHFGGRLGALLLKNPIEVPSWMSVLEENSVVADRFEGPMLLTKGAKDEVLPKALTDTFAAELCAAGVPVEYRVYPDASHASVTGAAAGDVGRWVHDRVEGRPVPSTC